MKRIHIIVAILVVIIIAVVYLSMFGMQTVSTDKQTYIFGEEVKIHWSDLSIRACSCSTPEIQIFRQEEVGWVKVQHQLSFFGGACVNGKMGNVGMPCDVVMCTVPLPGFQSGDYSWNTKIYERNGSVNSCFNPFTNETVNETMPNYKLEDAPAGTYKITFGNSETIIEIGPYMPSLR
jgi:hypothetical protein